jgi:hypothetical protein
LKSSKNPDRKLVAAALKKVIAAVDGDGPVILKCDSFGNTPIQDIVGQLKELPAGKLWAAWHLDGWTVVNQDPNSIAKELPVEEPVFEEVNNTLGAQLDQIAKLLNEGHELYWTAYASVEDFSASDGFVEFIFNDAEVNESADFLREAGFESSASALEKMAAVDSVHGS